MQKKFLVVSGIAIVAAVSILFCLPVFSGNNNVGNSVISGTADNTPSDSVKEEMKWYTVSEALELQKTTGKKIFIDVYTTWCGPCRMLSTGTFTNDVIAKELTDYYIPAKFNAESNDTIIFKGQTFTNPNYSPQPRKSTHPFAVYIASTPQGLGYPTMVFLDEESNMIQPISGYLTPQQLEPILSFFGTNAYKSTDWNTYYNSFKSSISQ